MRVERGDVVLISVPFSGGGGAKVRPAVVVQSDHNNRRLTNTILATITTATERALREPAQLLIELQSPEGKQSGLLSTSAVTCENIITVRQGDILRVIGRLPPDTMAKLNQCLKVSLALT
jgi:mRNA interferase MazF